MSRSLLRSGLIVSMMTFLSRVLGLIRDIVIADKIGAAAGADVFFFANRIPNFLRRLFAEGAFAQAFVPVLSEVKEKHGDDEVRLLVARAAGTLGVIVSIVTFIGVLCSGAIVALFGFGWFWDWLHDGPNADKFELASFMLKITFPYLWFITFVALSGAILNTYNRFAIAAFTPVFLNICMIFSALYLAEAFDISAIALAVGVLFGGIVQFVFQIPFLAKAGFMVRPQWAWRDPWVVKIRTLMLPAMFGVSVNQINLLLDTVIASFLMTGSISWLYYADRLIEFPLGIFGIGIATVVLPHLSALKAKGEQRAFQETMDWGVRFICFLGIPALAGLIALAEPIISVLYLRGEFTLIDLQRVVAGLTAYACGLVSFMLIKVLAPGFYARQDTKTPVRIGIKAMIANMIFNLLLAPWLGYVGLALATAGSASLNAFWLYTALKKEGVYHFTKATWLFLFKLAIAACTMFAVIHFTLFDVNEWANFAIFPRIGWLSVFIVGGSTVYFFMTFLLGIRIADLKNGSVQT